MFWHIKFESGSYGYESLGLGQEKSPHNTWFEEFDQRALALCWTNLNDCLTSLNKIINGTCILRNEGNLKMGLISLNMVEESQCATKGGEPHATSKKKKKKPSLQVRVGLKVLQERIFKLIGLKINGPTYLKQLSFFSGISPLILSPSISTFILSKSFNNYILV